LQHPADGRDAEIDEHDHRQVVLVPSADALVDRVAHEQPAPRLRGGVAGRDEDERERPRLLPFEIAPEPSHAATTSSPNSSAKAPPLRSSSPGVPDSTISPSSSPTARSASSTVESRCVAPST